MYRIGILEDDLKMGSELKIFLENAGYEVRFIEPAEYKGISEAEMIALLLGEELSLLLLDIGLPGFDGIRVCRELRAKSSFPVIMITSDSSEVTELMSIESGADDFIPKPFNTRILLARMEGILRRVYSTELLTDRKEVLLEDGRLFVLDNAKARVSVKEGEEAELTKNEFLILKLLVKNQGRVVSRDEIMAELWDNEDFVDDNTLTVNMTRLRSKLDQIGIKEAIATKRGAGYILN